MSDQPKPTGEWTAAWLRDQIPPHYSNDATALQICQMHNAELAAEREKPQSATWVSPATAINAAIEHAVAAEREKVETLVRELRHCANRIAGGYRSQSTMLTDDQLVTRADTVLAKVGKQ